MNKYGNIVVSQFSYFRRADFNGIRHPRWPGVVRIEADWRPYLSAEKAAKAGAQNREISKYLQFLQFLEKPKNLYQ